VLSVVAQQVMEIQLALKAKLRTFTFEGSELRLRPSCMVFITMNPGYAGASDRSVAAEGAVVQQYLPLPLHIVH
jgi:hypothetical protein